MRRACLQMLAAFLAAFSSSLSVEASTVAGGGSSTSDCALVSEIPGANKPAPPKTPKSVDCIDGDASCDNDGLRNGQCVFPIQICVNSDALDDCTPDVVNSVFVEHSIDDGSDPRFDTDFQALQSRVTGLGLPTGQVNRCALSSSITVKLRGPDSSKKMKTNKKNLRMTTNGSTGAGDVRDVDKVKFVCRPEGDAIYEPTDLYTSTFDRINKQVFQQSCALSSCHDSESHTGDLILLAGMAYGNIVGVTPDNPAAAADLLERVKPGDPDTSFLYLKLTGDLEAGYGDPMPYELPPLDANLIEIIRLWIIGDMTNGQAPETGWVPGTDQ